MSLAWGMKRIQSTRASFGLFSFAVFCTIQKIKVNYKLYSLGYSHYCHIALSDRQSKAIFHHQIIIRRQTCGKYTLFNALFLYLPRPIKCPLRRVILLPRIKLCIALWSIHVLAILGPNARAISGVFPAGVSIFYITPDEVVSLSRGNKLGTHASDPETSRTAISSDRERVWLAAVKFQALCSVYIIVLQKYVIERTGTTKCRYSVENEYQHINKRKVAGLEWTRL